MTLEDLLTRIKESGLHVVSCFAPQRRDGTRQCVFGGFVSNADYEQIVEAFRTVQPREVMTPEQRARNRAFYAADRE